MPAKRKVEDGPQLTQAVHVGGKAVRPLKEIEPAFVLLSLPVRKTSGAEGIQAGFRLEWGRIVDVDGRGPLVVCTGAGFGSSWATIDFEGKMYVLNAAELVESFLDQVTP